MVDINLLATLGGATIGAVVGSSGTYLARERSRKKQKKEEIENLRHSLLAELSSMDELANEKSPNYGNVVPAHSVIAGDVYKSNSAKISLLTADEAEAVIRFYSGANKMDNTLETIRELVGESDNPQSHDMTLVNESLDILREEWKTCSLALLSHLDDYPTEMQIDGRKVSVDESISPPELWIVLNHRKMRDLVDDIEFDY